jgi:hypothetical protein
MGFFGGGGGAASNMVGATSSAAGTAGLVPAPAAGDQGNFLRGDATFSMDSFSFLMGSLPSGSVLEPAINYSTASANYQENYAYYCPIIIPRRRTFDGIKLHSMRSANSQTVYLAIYNSSSDDPSSLVSGSDCSVVNPTSGSRVIVSFSSNITLEYGKYFIAVSFSGNTQIQTHASLGLNGYGSSGDSGSGGRYGTRRSNSTITNGSWNDPAPTLTWDTNRNIPALGLRVA